MKKSIIPLALIIIACAVFVLASQVESGVVIYKGWNLIYGFTPNSLNGQGFDFSHIKAIYTYTPMDNEYIRIYPNPENSKIDKYGDSYFEKQVMFVYSDVSVEGELNGVAHATEYWLEEPLPISETQRYSGWNFVGITPDVLGNSLNDLKGNCNIEKAYLWDAQNQQWGTILNLLDDKNILKNEGGMGGGFIVKVSNDCTLGSSGGITNPPELPGNGDSSNEDTSGSFQSFYFPEEISGYYLDEFNLNDKEECEELNGEEVCVKMARIEYIRDSENKMIHVLPVLVSKGREAYEEYIKQNEEISGGIYKLPEGWELGWIADEYIFITQDYSYIENDDGSRSNSLNTADPNNAVIQYFLNKYPPIE